MKILTNEYSCNTPNFQEPAKGGPANFARLFFNFLSKKNKKIKWYGLIVRTSDKVSGSLSSKVIKDDRKNRFIYDLSLSASLSQKILKARKVSDPKIILKDPIKKLSSIIKKIAPDIVFLNGFSLTNWLLLVAAKENNLKVVIQHAGIWTKEIEIYQDLFSDSGVKIMKQMERDSSVLSDKEIFLNTFSQQFFDKKVLQGKRDSSNKSVIIPLPVDFSFFKRQSKPKKEFNLNKERFNIGVVARWDRIKNLEAVVKISKAIKSKKLPWAINSVTNIPLSDKNINLKTAYRKNINVISFLNKEEIRDFCLQNDLIIIPSHFDVSPTILLEAVACKTPVAISTSVGFVDDYLRLGASDWVINFNNTKTAISQLETIKYKKLPTRVAKALINKHDLLKVFEKYLVLLNNLRKI